MILVYNHIFFHQLPFLFFPPFISALQYYQYDLVQGRTKFPNKKEEQEEAEADVKLNSLAIHLQAQYKSSV